MRYLFAIASLSLACCSIVLGRADLAPGSWFCREGLCPPGSPIEASSPSSALAFDFSARLNADASDPYLWSDYADSLDAHGDSDKAGAAFDHAVSLGPNLPPVLIRAAYFDFTHDRFDQGVALANRILSQTDALDPQVFSYLHYFGHGAAAVLGVGIPAAARPAHSWASWIAANGSDTEIRETFTWMQRNRLADRPTALALTWKLWQRQFFASAQELWSDWNGPVNRGVPAAQGQLLLNPQFENEPDGSPFDWTIPKDASVDISRDHGHGLLVRFLGTENVMLDGPRQSVIARPGRYHLSAVVESEGLTTDQRPFFRAFDPAHADRWNVSCPAVPATAAQSEIGCDFTVPQGTEALTVELERAPSDRFDSKIAGTLHIYDVSLRFSGSAHE